MEPGEGRTKAQPHPGSSLTLSACYTLCQVIFTPSKLQAVRCAVKNTIKLNYSGTRNFPPPHLSSFLHLIPEQRKITQRSIRKGEKRATSPAGVGWHRCEHSLGCSGSLPGSCISPAHPPGAVPLWPRCQAVSDKILCSTRAAVCCRPAPGEAVLGTGFPCPQRDWKWDGFAEVVFPLLVQGARELSCKDEFHIDFCSSAEILY